VGKLSMLRRRATGSGGRIWRRPSTISRQGHEDREQLRLVLVGTAARFNEQTMADVAADLEKLITRALVEPGAPVAHLLPQPAVPVRPPHRLNADHTMRRSCIRSEVFIRLRFVQPPLRGTPKPS